MAAKAVLERLLGEASKRYPIVYHGDLANHLSQGLIALYRLGGDAGHLRRFNDHYIKRLLREKPQREAGGRITEANWRTFVGGHDYYLDFVQFFKGHVAAHGAATSVSHFTQILAPCLSGAAFHGLIRLGYGVDLGTDEAIAEGLAYLAYAATEDFGPRADLQVTAPEDFTLPFIFQSLEVLRTSAPLQLVHSIPEFKDFPFAKKLHLLTLGLRSLSPQVSGPLLSRFTAFPPALTQEQAALIVHRLVLATILLYRGTGTTDFFLLHGVSATRAAQTILPLIDSPEGRSRILTHLWCSLLLTYANQGLPAIAPAPGKGTGAPEAARVGRWETVVGLALTSQEEHVIKMVYALRDEERHWGSHPTDPADIDQDVFLLTAEEMLRLLGLHGEHFTFSGIGFAGNQRETTPAQQPATQEELAFLKTLKANL